MNEPDGFEERTAFYEESYERDIEAIERDEKDEGYHVNEYGEMIPHAVTTYPRDSSAITTEIAKAVRS